MTSLRRRPGTIRTALNGTPDGTRRRRPGLLATAAGALGVLATSITALAVTPPAAQAASTGRSVLGVAAGGTLQFDTAAQQNTYLAAAHDLGATWLRFDFTWNDIQRSNSATFDWARYDSLVAAATAHGLQVVGMIGYAPSWARDPACAGDQMCRPADPAAYGKFAGQVAARYGPQGVHHWEIWNEPNTVLFFKPAADATYYTRMLSSAYQAIHAADPAASVITGGTAPAPTSGGNIAPVAFLTQMYAADAQGKFDALGHHPYCYAGAFDCPDTDAQWSAWSQMDITPTSLRGLMVAHGDGSKQIWGTEFGAPTSGGSTAVTEAHQSEMLSDGLARFSRYAWSGPLFLYSLQDRGTDPNSKEDWFGVLRANGTRKPAFATLQSALRSAAPPVTTPTTPPVTTTPPVSAPPVSTPPVASPTPPPVSTIVPVPVPSTAPAPVPAPKPGPGGGRGSFWDWLRRHPWF